MFNNKIEFTKEIHTELKKLGYTHIYSRGVLNERDESDNDFMLIPLKPTDPRITYEESDLHIEEINSSSVIDMLQGDPFIKFIVDTTNIQDV